MPVLLVALLGVSVPAAAEPDEAQAELLFREAKQLMDEGNIAKAL
jgi:hypothetical protein